MLNIDTSIPMMRLYLGFVAVEDYMFRDLNTILYQFVFCSIIFIATIYFVSIKDAI